MNICHVLVSIIEISIMLKPKKDKSETSEGGRPAVLKLTPESLPPDDEDLEPLQEEEQDQDRAKTLRSSEPHTDNDNPLTWCKSGVRANVTVTSLGLVNAW